MWRPGRGTWTTLASIGLVCAFVAGALMLKPAFVRLMALHIVLMSVLAPIAVLAWLRHNPGRRSPSGATLAIATILQATALYVWHLPAPHAAAAASTSMMLLMHASLGLVAAWFWYAVLARPEQARWPAVAALLATGKLFCLLGVLFVFSRRPLFGAGDAVIALGEQQLAGILMLGACPLTYLGAAFVITCRGLLTTARTPRRRMLTT